MIATTWIWMTNKVRTIKNDEGLWFCVRDIGSTLEYKNIKEMVRKLPDRYPIKVVKTENNREANYISEYAMWRLINRSNKPKAVEFQTWLETEVLPSIRKYGGFHTDEKVQKLIENIADRDDKISALKDELECLSSKRLGQLLYKMNRKCNSAYEWKLLAESLVDNNCVKKKLCDGAPQYYVLDESEARYLIKGKYDDYTTCS